MNHHQEKCIEGGPRNQLKQKPLYLRVLLPVKYLLPKPGLLVPAPLFFVLALLDFHSSGSWAIIWDHKVKKRSSRFE